MFFSRYHGLSNFQDHFSWAKCITCHLPCHDMPRHPSSKSQDFQRERCEKRAKVQLLESLDKNPAGGCVEKPMDINGYQWISMDINGYQWIMMLKNCPLCMWHAYRSGAIDVETFVLFGSMTWGIGDIASEV